MYLVAIFLTVAMALLGIGGLEIGLASQHGQAKLAASHLAQDYTDRGEQEYLSSVAVAVQAGTLPASGGIPTDSGSPIPVCASVATVCNVYGKYTITPGGGSGTGAAAGETSQNINTNVSETRDAATIDVTLTNPNGAILAQRSRTFTLRTFPVAPYAAVVSSSDSLEPYNTTGTVGAVSSATEGDASGCVGGPGNASNATCGESTLVKSFGTCENLALTQTGLSPVQLKQYQLYQQYCADMTHYNASATASSGFAPAPTSTYAASTWTNGNAKASGN